MKYGSLGENEGLPGKEYANVCRRDIVENEQQNGSKHRIWGQAARIILAPQVRKM